MPDPIADATALFQSQRPRLLGLAYRMLGDRAAAEDVVQEGYLRWSRIDPATLANPGAFLTRIVTRLAIDDLRARKARREVHGGPWLPEPVIDGDHEPWGLGEDISSVLMVALERLSPLERAVFLLHDIFERDFAEIAETLERTPEACRQLASRARRHVGRDQRRHALDAGEGERLAQAFLVASRRGDVDALRRMLAEDAVLVTDGGGVRPAALLPILGRERILRFYAGLARKADHRVPPRLPGRWILGGPGLVTLEADGLPQVTTLEVGVDGTITHVHVLRDPAKLRALVAGVEAGFSSPASPGP
jgi:RNA polymerase sigma-70 factor (ECF subfamily)